MIIFPAIDIKDGKCVRLKQGDFNYIDTFGEDPAETALKWQSQGGKYLHVVDLDGALAGTPVNREAIKNILKVITIPLQLGGGIRNEKSIYDMLELGVSRIILGTSALQDKAFTKLMIQKYKGKIAVSIDAKNGYAAVNGWTEVSEIRAIDLANELAGYGLETLIYTDIAKDGMLAGPNFKELDDMNKGVPIDIIASGGISRVNDIEKLMQMQLYGAIIGKALYTGAISLNDISGKMEE